MGRKRSIDTLHNTGIFVDWLVTDPLLGRWWERITIGSPAWFSRIENEHPRFSFELDNDRTVTLRAEEKQRGSFYWVAYKRHGEKLRKQYVGRTDALTYERLCEVCQFLNSKTLSDLITQHVIPTAVQLWTPDRFKARTDLSTILIECQQEFKKRYGHDLPWSTVERRGMNYYAMPGNQFLGKRAHAIKAVLQWVNHGRDNAAARRDGAA